VICPTCSFEIPLATGQRLPNDFSILCPNCGQRKFYRPADLRALAPDVEAVHAIRRIAFSTGKKQARPTKSWLTG
jgi:predicted RNA-binding Zn-ribbon protein involved in translation (DUF1610 family)